MNFNDFFTPFIEPAGFFVLSFIFGFFISILDIIITYFRGNSILNIKYKNKIIAILCWSFGAGIVGFFGGLLKIFDSKGMTQSALFIAICWPMVFTNLVEQFSRKKRDDNNP